MTRKKPPPKRKRPPRPMAPADISEMMQRAVNLHQRGRLEDAEQLYHKVLEAAPNNVNALHYLGVLSQQRGQIEFAMQRIRQAIQIDPNYVDAHNNLGNVLTENGQLTEAEAEYRQVIALDPHHAEAYNNLGSLLRQRKKYDEAIEALEKSIELQPNSADTYDNLGNALKGGNRLEEALTAYRKAIEIQADHNKAHLNLGRALHRDGRVDEAAVVFHKWAQVAPDNPVARHMLAASTGENVPRQASAEFIQETFDGFAGSFDKVLVLLGYRAPELVVRAMKRVLTSRDAHYDVLDAGCGTGLCGPLLRPFARRLVGVDLSARMLDKARGLEVYDELINAELAENMEQSAEQYDIIVSADTLIYFGALEGVLSAAAKALRTGGHFIFTLEHAGEEQTTPSGYRLNPHGRYIHTQDYAERMLQDARLTACRISCDTLRQEIQQPVAGLVITARK